MHAGCNFTKEIKKTNIMPASDKTQQSLQLHPPQMTNVWKDNAEGKDKNFHFGQKCFQTPQMSSTKATLLPQLPSKTN
jgi:hypothetical protein